jgi:hypothetical protein
MPKFHTIKPGDVLWEKRRQRMGNTTMRETAIFRVLVLSVDAEKETAEVSWNGNPAKTWHKRNLEKLTRKKPEQKRSIFR